MNIQITDDYVMTSDPHNFILNEVTVIKSGKDAGQKRLRAVAFFQSVPDLVEGLITLQLRESTQTSMQGLAQEHAELCENIRELFRVGITGIGTMPCKECGQAEECVKPEPELRAETEPEPKPEPVEVDGNEAATSPVSDQKESGGQ